MTNWNTSNWTKHFHWDLLLSKYHIKLHILFMSDVRFKIRMDERKRSEWMKERKAKKWLDLERGHIIQVFCWQSLHKILMKNRHVSTCFKNVFCCYVYVILLLFCVVRKSNLNPLFLCTDYTDLTQLDWTVMFWIEMSSQNQLNLNVVQRVAAANSS